MPIKINVLVDDPIIGRNNKNFKQLQFEIE